MRMVLFFICYIFSFAGNALDDTDKTTQAMRALDWHVGPKNENIASKAILKTDSTLVFLDENNSKKYLELTKNIPDPGNFILVSNTEYWWAAFSFNPIGYVKDDEKIDPDALLEKLKTSDEKDNVERRRLGLPELNTIGWYMPPHYDTESKHLEWGLRLQSGDHEILNYTIRLLGKTGFMNVILVSSAERLDADVKSLKGALAGFEFNTGERYAEFKEGDKVAEYGLAALIAGGAAAVAAKKGFFSIIAAFLAASWKLVAVAVLGFFSFIGSLFKRK